MLKDIIASDDVISIKDSSTKELQKNDATKVDVNKSAAIKPAAIKLWKDPTEKSTNSNTDINNSDNSNNSVNSVKNSFNDDQKVKLTLRNRSTRPSPASADLNIQL